MADGVSRTYPLHRVGLPSLLATLIWFTAHPAIAGTLNVAAGGDLQGALDSAHCGDTIVLQAGATYTPSLGYVLPAPRQPCTGADSDYVTVTSSAAAFLPSAGKRLDPSLYGQYLAKMVAPDSFPILSTRTGANHWRFVGIDFTSTGSKFIPILINLGQSSSHWCDAGLGAAAIDEGLFLSAMLHSSA